MAKTKQNWIDEVKGFGQEALGDVTDADLAAMNIGQLKALKKELEKETGKTETPDPVKEETKQDVPESKFISMCGSEFDPKKSGSCHTQCAKDFPEAFQACVENFKREPEKPARQKKTSVGGGSGKTIWNHIASSQAGLIDECIISGKQMTLKEIAEHAKAKELRTLAHIKHLVADWKVTVLFDEREVEGKKEIFYFWADKCPGAPGTPLEGKTAYK